MSYGQYWEKYPIQKNEIWAYKKSQISVFDITQGIPDYMHYADMIYSDTPWSLQNVNMFNKKANRAYMQNFSQFYNPLFKHIRKMHPAICYLEIGKQNLELFKKLLGDCYNCIQIWQITYYKKYPCYLLRGAFNLIDFDFTGMDDAKTPELAINIESPRYVCDFCTGRGLTGLASIQNGCCFLGTELNQRKLAIFIHKAKRLGYEFKKI
jgi:hypothetical protein